MKSKILFIETSFTPKYVNEISRVFKNENIDDIIEKCKTDGLKTIFNSSIRTNEILFNNLQKLKQNDIGALVTDSQMINICNHKTHFVDFMIENGFKRYVPEKYDKMQYPCILKKNVSLWGAGCHILESKYDIPANIEIDDYLCQELILGKVEYTTHILAHNGKSIKCQTYQFTFNEDHHVKGFSNTPANKKIIQYYHPIFERILTKLNYNGFCCFNFKLRGYSPKIFELNPRIGTSLSFNRTEFDKFVDKYINLVETDLKTS